MMTLLHIGEQLQAARQTAKLRKTQLAKISGVHRNTLRNLEAGHGNVEMATLLAVCDALGLSIDISLVPKDALDSAPADAKNSLAEAGHA